MNRRVRSAMGWILIALLIAPLPSPWLAVRAGKPPTSAPPDLPRPAAVRPLLRPGEPLPGAAYPAAPVHRAAPAGWKPSAPPPGIDLDVTFIHRDPTYLAYCVDYPAGIPILCPGTEDEPRWPAPGEVVTFTAHIVNKGAQASPDFGYEWAIDGAAVATGTLPALAPAAETTVTYHWPWAHTMDGERVLDDHTVRLAADPAGLIGETYETNNAVEDRTNALGFGITITPEMVEAYNTPWNPAFSYSAEDWLQRQIAAMNASLAASIYPLTPAGATERVRIGDIQVVSSPPWWNRATDGGWFVDADYRVVSAWYDPAADADWGLVHELSHQVGLIDLYQYNTGRTSVKVLDREAGPTNLGFGWPRPDIMGGGDIAPYTDPHLYSAHSAGGISSTKGYRRGYYGEYQYDLAAENYVLVLDNQGNPAAGVQVDLYQRTGPPNWMGELDVDDTPEISGLTGVDGRLLLANRPAGGGVTTRTGHTLHDNPFGVVDVVGGRNLMLIKLGLGDHQEFHWTDLTGWNLAYWAGDTLSHTLTLASHVPPPGAPAPPPGPAAQIQAEQAGLCWQPSPSPGVVGANVYRAGPPEGRYERVAGPLTGPCWAEASPWARVYAVTAVDSADRESGFSSFLFAPRLIHPAAVGLTSDGLRTILDPQNGYALLRQRPDGRYVQNVGSVHYHLENSTFMAVDEQDRLIFSHPGDWYTGRHSVRVADRDATPLLEFGEWGSGPGQFQTPAGVAAVGEPADIGGPYDVDEHTLLLSHLDGSYDGAQGEPGTPSGATFVPGKIGQGVLFNWGASLTYDTAGNLERTQGAIEFWLQPHWAGNDRQGYTFFEVGDEWFNRMRITKDGANNLRFLVWDSSTEYGVTYNVAHWLAYEWHHVAVTWQGTSIALYVDGRLRDRTDAGNVPDVLADTISIGSSGWHDQFAQGIIDELRISDVPRLGRGGAIPYRILVADSGNHRLQAFDEMGSFVAAYGDYGSGPGQFSNPQGLAALGHGQIVVADAGNDRLQLLSFDGTTFGFVRSITAGLKAPAGVAAGPGGLIAVSDTGNNRVLLLDVDGRVRAVFAQPDPPYTGPFNQPYGLAWEPAGRLVIADMGNGRVVTASPPSWQHSVYLPLARRDAP